MAHSSDFIDYTCFFVVKNVRKLDLSNIEAEYRAGEIGLEEALQQAARVGARFAQANGADKVRAVFDAYISRAEGYLTEVERDSIALSMMSSVSVRNSKAMVATVKLLRDK